MEEYEVGVRYVTFIVEAEDEDEAKAEVVARLMDRAHDWGKIEVL